MAEKRRLNLSFSLASPQQREAWSILRSIPAGQRTDAVCRMVCRAQEQEALLDAVRRAIQEELGNFQLERRTEEAERQQAGDVDDSILGFLRALQEEGDVT